MLRLVHQTMWNDPDHTTLNVAVRAVNHSTEDLDDLSLTIAVFTRVGSRSEYEDSLEGTTGNFLLGNTTPVEGSVPSGEERVLHLPETDLADLASFGDTAIYPMSVELRSHEEPVAVLRSPVIFLAQNPPEQPLDLTWTFVLAAPILYEPGGAFRSPWLQRQVAHGGAIRAEAEALAKLVARPDAPSLDIVVGPQLIDQLMRMRRGYTLDDGTTRIRVKAGEGGARAADQVLQDLKEVAASPDVELSALPYASVSIPALILGGLATDLPAQLAKGRDVVEDALGRRPSVVVFRPPGSRLDQQSAYELQQNGIRVLLVDEGTVEQSEPPRGFAKPPVSPLSVGTSTPLQALSPDAGVQTLLSGTLTGEDPHLAAQAVAGELASIWLEQPSVSRGVALALTEHNRAPGYFYAPFLRSISRVPWLEPIKALTMTATHPSTSDEAASIAAPPGPSFSTTYLTEMNDTRSSIEVYRSIITDDRDLPAQLEQVVLLAESGQFASDETLGESFLEDVRSRLQQQYRLVAPDTSVPVRTLSSHNGRIPISILNSTGHPVKVRVRLSSSHLTFQHGGTQLVSIPGDGATLLFPVQARTTGRFPLRVTVTTPDGTTTLSSARFVVRSTAYNRIALVITIGAALFLLALWARRFVAWTKR